MYRCLSALAILLAGSAAAAQEGKLLESAECRQALADLQAREVAASQPEGRPRAAADPQREALRRRAAQICLGGDARTPPPSPHSAVPPIVVPRIVVAPPAAPRPLTPAPTAPPIQAKPPTFVTACDAAGCWTSDGLHLPRMGTLLQGPTGLCSMQGALLHCP